MSRRLGVDLSSTRAALASVRETRRRLELRGFAIVDAQGTVEAIARDLTQVRCAQRFPRTAEVIAWPGDRRVDAVTQSGCRVERIITPGEALARVARLHYQARPLCGVTAVVSLHLTSGAVAVVRDGRLLFETKLAWSVVATLSSADPELLQRYTFVSELTESLRRVFNTVRARQGAEVNEILTCGSLPDLRSLTMPLAAEFDVEVETFDLTDDIEIRVPEASPEQMRDTIASLRLAIVAGKRWHRRTVKDLVGQVHLPRVSVATRIAAVAAAGVIAAFLWVRFGVPAQTPNVLPAAPADTAERAQQAAVIASTRPATGAGSSARAAAAKPPLTARPLRVTARLQPAPRGLAHAQIMLALAKAEQAVAVYDSSHSMPRATATPAPVQSSRVAAAPAPPTAVPSSAKPSLPEPAPAVPPGRSRAATLPSGVATKPSSGVASAAGSTQPPRAPTPSSNASPTQMPMMVAKSQPGATPPLTAPAAQSRPPAGTNWSAGAAVLKPPASQIPNARAAGSTSAPVAAANGAAEPRVLSKSKRSFLPAPADVVVTSILWSSDRQLAIVNGRIVGAGDVVGAETVVDVRSDGVIFRDRAGRLRRAALREGS